MNMQPHLPPDTASTVLMVVATLRYFAMWAPLLALCPGAPFVPFVSGCALGGERLALRLRIMQGGAQYGVRCRVLDAVGHIRRAHHAGLA